MVCLLKIKKIQKKLKQKRDSRYIYSDELDEACFYILQHILQMTELLTLIGSKKEVKQKAAATMNADAVTVTPNLQTDDKLHKPINRKSKVIHLLEKAFGVPILLICN